MMATRFTAGIPVALEEPPAKGLVATAERDGEPRKYAGSTYVSARNPGIRS